MVMNPNKAQDVWKDAGEHVQFTVLELKRENQAKEQEAIQEFVERFQAITRSLRIRDNKGNLKVSLGFSNDAWDYLFPNAPKPKELETYQTLTGPKYKMPAAKGDIFLHIRANDEAAVYEFMAQVMLFIRDITNVVDETRAFAILKAGPLLALLMELKIRNLRMLLNTQLLVMRILRLKMVHMPLHKNGGITWTFGIS